MKINPVVLLLAPKAAAAVGTARNKIASALDTNGFEVVRCLDVLELYRSAQESLRSERPALVLLAGTHAENCVVARYMRTLHPQVGIVVMLEDGTEQPLLEAVQAGADTYCLHDASSALLLALMLRLLSRVNERRASHAATDPASPGVWSLQEQAWTLVTPSDKRIPLTTGERAFLSFLLAAPGQRATHDQLIDAVNTGYAIKDVALRQGRLGVLVSRLRRKLTEHGIELPLKSMHNWGYMFTGPL